MQGYPILPNPSDQNDFMGPPVPPTTTAPLFHPRGTPPKRVNRGLGGADGQGEGEDSSVTFPAVGELAWLARLRRWLDESCSPDQDLLLAGDLNVTPTDGAGWEAALRRIAEQN